MPYLKGSASCDTSVVSVILAPYLLFKDDHPMPIIRLHVPPQEAPQCDINSRPVREDFIRLLSGLAVPKVYAPGEVEDFPMHGNQFSVRVEVDPSVDRARVTQYAKVAVGYLIDPNAGVVKAFTQNQMLHTGIVGPPPDGLTVPLVCSMERDANPLLLGLIFHSPQADPALWLA